MSGAAAAPAPRPTGPMRSAIQRLTGETVVYGLGQVGGRAVQLLLVPILTRAFTPGAFGVSELVAGYSQAAALVLVLGMDGALARFFYQEPDREARIRMVSTSFVFRLAVTWLIALALVAVAGPLAARLFGGEVYRKYLAIGAVTLPFTLLVMFANDVLRVTFQPWKFIVLNLVQTVLVTSLALFFVLRWNLGVVGVLYGRLAGDGASALVGLVLIRHSLAPRFNRAALRRMLSYGLPALPATIAFAWLAGIDRYMMQRYRSLEELAVYAVAAKFFAVVTMGASAFQLAYGPFAYAQASSPQAPRLFARVLMGYIAIGSLGAMLVGLFAPEALAILVPPAYRGAATPALLLAFAAVALGAYTVTSVGIGLALRTRLLGWCAGSAALAAAAGHLVLTRRYGAQGAAAATLLGYAAGAVVTYRIAQRVHPFPYRGGRVLALAAAALALAYAAQNGSPAGPLGWGWKLAAVAAFVALCVRLRVWTDAGAVARFGADPVV